MSTAAPESRKKLSAKAFSSSGLWCPHCGTKLADELPSCSSCGFRLDACSEILGAQAPQLEFLLDPGSCLPDGSAEQLAPLYQKLQKKFPQLALCLCFVELNPPLKPNELAFWLMNVAPEATDRRAWTVTIVFEVSRFEAGLSPGYGIEPFIKPEAWSTFLGEVTTKAHAEGWVPALEDLLKGMQPILQEARRKVSRRTRKIANKTAS